MSFRNNEPPKKANSLTLSEDNENLSDVLLTETNTIWTISLAGTCIEQKDDNSGKANKAECDTDERWCQTIDFPRKKKGTQSDYIHVKETEIQTNASDMAKSM